MPAAKTLLPAVAGLAVGGVVLVLAAVAAAFHLATTEKVYESRAMLYLSLDDVDSDQYVDTPMLGSAQLRACAEVTRSGAVVHDVLESLRLTTPPRALQQGLEAEVVPETSLLRLTVRHSSPIEAQRLGGAWADSSARLLGGPTGLCSTAGQPLLTTVTDQATYEPDAVSPDVGRTLLVAGVAGLAAAVALGLAAALVARRSARPRAGEPV